MTADHLVPRRSRGFEGRDRLDRSSSAFRRAVARLARETERDEHLAGDLEEIIGATCAALDALRDRAERAAVRSSRNQARVRRQLDQVEQQLRRAPLSAGSDVEREAELLRGMLEPETGP